MIKGLTFGANAGGNMQMQNRLQNLRLRTADAGKIVTEAERKDKTKLVAALEKRLLQAKLSAKQEQTLRDYLDSQSNLNDTTILVILQMAGGNDGLNTVVPFTNDYYHRARPGLGLAAKEVLKLNDELGLHSGLSGFKDLYDGGKLAIVQGIGYPNPNRSHF